MDTATLLQKHTNELSTAITSLASQPTDVLLKQVLTTPSDVEPNEAFRAKRDILSLLAKMRALVAGPTDFIQHLASQTEVLASLRWLGEFQILACIPLKGSVPIQDLATLTRLQSDHLTRVIRLTASIGFLKEPQAYQVEHTHLSAAFVLDPSYLDAVMFMAESAAPTALQMAQATREGAMVPVSHSSIAQRAVSALDISAIPESFLKDYESPRLRRQLGAYFHHAGGLHTTADVVDVLKQLSWGKIPVNGERGACVVESGVKSLSTSLSRSLARLHPNLRFLVQLKDPLLSSTGVKYDAEDPLGIPFHVGDMGNVGHVGSNTQVTIGHRILGARQTATDAAVYILHLPSLSPEDVYAELMVHFEVLRVRKSVLLIWTARLLHDLGTTPDPEVETAARSRDLLLLQLAGQGEMEISELLDVIAQVGDGLGSLIVTSRLRSRHQVDVALMVKYHEH